MTGSPASGDSFDVIVVGAGLSGIAAGHYLQRLCPGERLTILEAREEIGGTWDLFRYPGVRSDSDMSTLGYSFWPWQSDASFATGAEIRQYVNDTARAERIDRHIRHGHRVTAAAWDTAQARWTVTAATGAGEVRLHGRFLFFCSGYYDYEHGHEPDWAGREAFRGRIVHPQHWPPDLDCTGRRVVVIGSGATAVTLLPALAQDAAHVTMLQRSPTYIMPLPARDRIAGALQRVLPRALSGRLVRWKNIAIAMAFFQYCRRWPAQARRLLLRIARRFAGPDVDVERHLAPRYQPWDQRLCIAPGADFFKALRSGKASIVTDTIERFTTTGLRLASGTELPADIVVTATGLSLKLLGGVRISIDGTPFDAPSALVYRGMMFSGVPNLALATGYTNASWTLKCELVARYVCRLLNHLRSHGLDSCTPVVGAQERLATQPFLDLTSGYVQRAAAALPRQGTRGPWRMHQNYLLDLLSLKYAPLRDGRLQFARRRDAAG